MIRGASVPIKRPLAEDPMPPARRRAPPPLPRVSLAHVPTPIEELARLGAGLGVRLFVKRDDLTEAVLTGNKVRKLEYLLAAAREAGSDTVVTCGGIQSNHARATAGAAARLGMRSVLVLRDPALAKGDRGKRSVAASPAAAGTPQGNLLLDRLLGAEVRWITPAEYAERDAIMAEVAREIGEGGRRAYVIPEGGSNGLGALGYVRAAEEIAQDASSPFDVCCCATGSGGTLAGLAAGFARLGLFVRVLGFAVCDSADYFRERVRRVLSEVAIILGDKGLAHAPFEVDDAFIGPGYGQNVPEDLEVIVDVAREEGLVLDPVYTAKAFRGMRTRIRDGGIPRGARVLFVHTGGVFGLLPRGADLPLDRPIPSKIR